MMTIIDENQKLKLTQLNIRKRVIAEAYKSTTLTTVMLRKLNSIVVKQTMKLRRSLLQIS